jgi:hyaluronate lyase
VTGSTLAGKKAWFMFGDKILAVGAGISSTNSVNIETIIENRKLNAAGSNTLTVNGTAQSSTVGASLALSAVNWAHLAGSVTGSDIAWYFPDAPAVTALREARTGSWSQVYSAGSTTAYTNNFLSLALSHGSNPTAGAYSYVILPNRSTAQAAAYAASPTVAVLERSTAAIAVRDTALGLVGADFWADASKTVNMDGAAYLTSDKKAAVLTQEADGVLKISVADPTQANTGTINIEIARKAGVAVAVDSGVTVTQLSPTIKLAVNVNGSAGKSYTASFKLIRTASLGSSADAYVRDGTYAATNYGSTATMVIKNDATSYARQGYVKFDLSSLGGSTITGATLKLGARALGQTTAMSNNIYLVADGWTESGITWNARPAEMSLLGSWTVPALNTYATLDVTSSVSSAFSGDKVVSFRIDGAANYGANGWVEYATKENTTVKPVLEVSYY